MFTLSNPVRLPASKLRAFKVYSDDSKYSEN